ncbi:hypothetical protein JET88_05490 [Pseudomonas aeruginosa]|nr:hypothetical protein [Pseudomonas aeruginosa]
MVSVNKTPCQSLALAGCGGDHLIIPAIYMRGGTSKGVFFRADALPSDPKERDALLLRVVGSPDPYGKQTDGMGGATSSTSKVVIVGKCSDLQLKRPRPAISAVFDRHYLRLSRPVNQD